MPPHAFNYGHGVRKMHPQAAILLWNCDPQPTQICHSLPKLWGSAVLVIDLFTNRIDRRVGTAKISCRLKQHALLFAKFYCRHTASLLWQSEHALANDVVLDLASTATDRSRKSIQIRTLPHTTVDSLPTDITSAVRSLK